MSHVIDEKNKNIMLILMSTLLAYFTLTVKGYDRVSNVKRIVFIIKIVSREGNCKMKQ